MTAVTFDKLAYVDALKSGGFSAEQARAQANALEDAFKDSIVTKGILKDEIHPIKTDIAVLKWMVGVSTAGVIALVMKSFFM